jgi:hypothetical protein
MSETENALSGSQKMKSVNNLAGQRASIREGWTAEERHRRKRIADRKLMRLCHLLAESSDCRNGLQRKKNSEVATAC